MLSKLSVWLFTFGLPVCVSSIAIGQAFVLPPCTARTADVKKCGTVPNSACSDGEDAEECGGAWVWYDSGVPCIGGIQISPTLWRCRQYQGSVGSGEQLEGIHCRPQTPEELQGPYGFLGQDSRCALYSVEINGETVYPSQPCFYEYECEWDAESGTCIESSRVARLTVAPMVQNVPCESQAG